MVYLMFATTLYLLPPSPNGNSPAAQAGHW
jgi:hypothetical protein